jgi:hypothetical protein
MQSQQIFLLLLVGNRDAHAIQMLAESTDA